MARLPPALHFVLFPLMAQGHMIPMVDLARLLAERGSTITIVTTPVNATRFKPVIDLAIKDNLKIQVLELKFPSTQVGLPEGCENFDMIPSAQLFMKLFEAATMLEQPAESLLRRLTPAPTCIVSDNLLHWTSCLARKFDIPRLIFHGPGCFTLLCIHMAMNTSLLDEIESDSEYFVLPGLPDRIELTKSQASGWGGKHMKEKLPFFAQVGKAEQAADGIVINSFRELEPSYVDELAKAKAKKVWCIGPVSLCNKRFEDLAERGNKGATNEPDCMKWLDSKEPGSVIFVCLGSLARASTEQNIELGLGLESSNKPFIWCLNHIGVKIGIEILVFVGEQDKLGVVVNKEDIKRSVEDVMDKGEEGEARRKRSRELAKMAKSATEDGGSSHRNLTLMIQDMVELLDKNTIGLR
ncbi:hypothetical protein R6Q59_024664 [Mikania micrantha]